MTTATNIAVASAVPVPIVRSLRRVIRRARLVLLFRGLCAMAAAALACLLAIMAVDAGVILFAAWPRFALSLSALAVTAAVAWRLLIRPLARTFTLAGVARAIEMNHPELHERISSAVELLSSDEAEHFRGSNALVAILAQDAARDASSLKARREVTLRALRPYLIAAGAAAVIMAGLLLASPEKTSRLLARAIAPNLNLANVSAAQVTVSPGDTVIAEGRRLEVSALVTNNAVNSAELLVATADGRETAQAMAAAAGGSGENQGKQFAVTLPPAAGAEGFRYRVHAGDALTRYYTVRVVPPPSVTRLDIRYEYPDYTHREPRMEASSGGDIRALEGTRVTVIAHANKPIASAELLVDEKPMAAEKAEPPPGIAADNATACAITLTPKLQGRWTLRLTDEYGFSTVTEPRAIEALPDAPPVARIISPEAPQLKLKPDDKLPIIFALSDDHGLSAAELLVEVDGKRQQPIALPLEKPKDEKPLRATGGQFTLNLAELNVGRAARVTFQVRALDNLPAPKGPQEGLSALHTIALDVKAETYANQVEMALELRIRGILEGILKDIQAARADSEPLRAALAKKAADLAAESLQRIDRIRKSAGSADAATRDLIAQATDGVYAKLVEKLTTLADGHLTPAEAIAGNIKLTDSPAERAGMGDEADLHLLRAAAIVSDLLKDFQVMTEMVERARELEDLANKETELAAAKAAMESAAKQAASQPASQPAGQGVPPGGLPDKKQPMTEEQWKKAQQAVAQQLAEMMKKTPSALGIESKNDQKATVDLAAEARELAKQQAALATDTSASAQIQEAHNAIAAAAQRETELAKAFAQEPSLAEAGKTLAAAAEDMKAGKTDEAAAKLAAADAAAAKALDELKRQQATASAADTAEQIAKQQADLAAKAAAAKKAFDEAQTKATAAGQAGDASRQKAQEQQQKLAAALADLQKRQKALADQARQVEQAVAGNPHTAAAQQKPSASMDAVTNSLAASNADQAAAQAKQASAQSDQLNKQVEAAKQQAASQDPAAGAKAAEQGATAARTAKQTADTAAAQAAVSAKTTADSAAQLDAAAKNAEANAAAAKTAADAAQAAAAADAAAKQQAATAAQQAAAKARQDAETAKGTAATAKSAADSAAQQAAQAATNAAAAEKKLAEAQKAQADFATNAAAAKKIAEQAAQLADAQKKLTGEIAAAPAGPAKELAQHTAAAAQSDQQKAAHAQASDAQRNAAAGLAPTQKQLAAQAAEVVAQADKLAPAAGDAVKKSSPAADMQKASAAMDSKDPAAAAQAAADAAAKAAELAKALRQADPNAKAGELAQRAAKAEQLLAQQRAAAPATAEGIKRLSQLADAFRKSEAARLAAEQAEVAKAVGELSDRVKQLSPQADRLDSVAARSSIAAGEQMQAGKSAEAAASADDAGAKLGELAKRMGADAADYVKRPDAEMPTTRPANAAGEPTTRPTAADNVAVTPGTSQKPAQVAELQQTPAEKRIALADDTARLAARQQRLAGEIKALAAGETTALALSRQDRLADRTAELAEGTERIRRHADELIMDPATRQDAVAAASEVNKSTAAQQEAHKQLAAGASASATPHQQGSAAALLAAADALDRLGKHLAEQASKLPPPEDEESPELAKTFDQADKAEDATDAALAAKLLAELSQHAAQQAGQMGLQPSAAHMSEAMMKALSSMGGGSFRPVPGGDKEAALAEMGISITDWARISGELRDSILQAAEEGGPEEYRPLIKRYFQQLAKRGTPAAPPPERRP